MIWRMSIVPGDIENDRVTDAGSTANKEEGQPIVGGAKWRLTDHLPTLPLSSIFCDNRYHRSINPFHNR
jgi:hypothetical protein